MIIFDFDQTLVDTSPAADLRANRKWSAVMTQAKAGRLPVYPGVSEMLAVLHAKGHRLAILTKSPDMVPRWYVEHYGWPIDIVLGYHQVKRRKPDPEGLLLAMKAANASPDDTHHVGDQAQDTEASRAANVIAIGVTWGIASKEELEASRPNFIFDTVSELQDYFR